MRIVGNNPKKASWQIFKATYPDGRVTYVSGQYPEARFMNLNHQDNWLLSGHVKAGANIELAPNPIVYARLKAHSQSAGRSTSVFRLSDADQPECTFEVGAGNMLEIIRALEDGRLTLERGAICGNFTFQKKGTEVYLSIADAAPKLDKEQDDGVLMEEDDIPSLKM